MHLTCWKILELLMYHGCGKICWPNVAYILTYCYPDIHESCSKFFDSAMVECLINLCTKKNTKTHRNKKNEQCSCMNIFKRIVDRILIVFVGSNTPLRLLLTRISWPQVPYSKKLPHFKATVAFLANFHSFFTNTGLNIVNICWTISCGMFFMP